MEHDGLKSLQFFEFQHKLLIRDIQVNVLIYIEMLFIFSTPGLIRHLWQLKTVVYLHWCLIQVDLLKQEMYLKHFIFFITYKRSK